MTNAPHAYPTERERVAANVRAEAARRGISQAALAQLLNINQAGISRRMSGKIDFSAPELSAIAAQFGVPVGTFFGEVAA